MIQPQTEFLFGKDGRIVRIQFRVQNKRVQVVPTDTLIRGYTDVESSRHKLPIKEFFNLNEALVWLVSAEP